MNRLTLFSALPCLLLALTGQPATAHGGEDHGAAAAPGGKGMTYFTSQAVSEKYELVLHYQPLEAGESGCISTSSTRTNPLPGPRYNSAAPKTTS